MEPSPPLLPPQVRQPQREGETRPIYIVFDGRSFLEDEEIDCSQDTKAWGRPHPRPHACTISPHHLTVVDSSKECGEDETRRKADRESTVEGAWATRRAGQPNEQRHSIILCAGCTRCAPAGPKRGRTPARHLEKVAVFLEYLGMAGGTQRRGPIQKEQMPNGRRGSVTSLALQADRTDSICFVSEAATNQLTPDRVPPPKPTQKPSHCCEYPPIHQCSSSLERQT